jgi:outer membrane murein-binding lipoprotein Lpp
MEPPATIPHQVLNFPMSASAAAASSEQKSEAKPEVQSSSIILGAQPDTPGRDELPEKVADDLGAAIAAALAEQKDVFTESLKESVGQHASTMVTTTFAKVAGQMEQKINAVETKVDDLATKFEQMGREHRAFQADVIAKLDDLAKGNAANAPNSSNRNGNTFPIGQASLPPLAPQPGVFADGSGVGILLGAGDFFRTPDPCKLFVNTLGRVPVAGEKFAVAFRKLAEEAGLPNLDSIDISGSDLDSRFEITFACAPAAKQFLGSLFLGKDPKGKPLFKEQLVDSSHGPIQFFVNPDKNSAQVKKEVLCKKLATFLQAYLPPNTLVTASRVNGRVFVGQKRAVSILIKDESSFSLDWDRAYCNTLKLEYPVVEQAFRSEVSQSSS